MKKKIRNLFSYMLTVALISSYGGSGQMVFADDLADEIEVNVESDEKNEESEIEIQNKSNEEILSNNLTENLENTEENTLDFYDSSLEENDSLLSVGVDLNNEAVIYRYLVNELGCNTATACGIVANIEKESGFNPLVNVKDTNGLYS